MVDVANPEIPAIVASVGVSVNAGHLAVSGSFVYVACQGFGVWVIDISNPLMPQYVSQIVLPYFATNFAYNVEIDGTHAYIMEGGSGFHVADISNPYAPLIVCSVDTPGGASDIAIAGDYAYVADGRYGLHVVDISTPMNAHVMGGMDPTPVEFDGQVLSVVAMGDFVYATHNQAGFFVAPTQCSSQPSAVEIAPSGIESVVAVFPNPAPHRVTVRFGGLRSSAYTAIVHDIAGRRVRVLETEVPAGDTHEFVWDGRDANNREVAAGIYFLRIESGTFAATARVAVVR